MYIDWLIESSYPLIPGLISFFILKKKGYIIRATEKKVILVYLVLYIATISDIFEQNNLVLEQNKHSFRK